MLAAFDDSRFFIAKPSTAQLLFSSRRTSFNPHQTLSKLAIPELAVHGIAATLKGHLGEVAAIFVLRTVLLDGGKVMFEIPQKPPLEEILEWFKLELRLCLDLICAVSVIVVFR